MSVGCDCCAVAEDPCMDVGILISTDPIAIDQKHVLILFMLQMIGKRSFD